MSDYQGRHAKRTRHLHRRRVLYPDPVCVCGVARSQHGTAHLFVEAPAETPPARHVRSEP